MLQLELIPAPAPPPKLVKPRKPVDPARKELWSTGLYNLASLLGKRETTCRNLLGRLSAAAKHDYSGLTALLARAVELRPDDPVPWLVAGARTIGNPQPWALDGWYDIAPASVRDWPLEVYADIMLASRLPPSWRGSLAVLEALAVDGYRMDMVVPVVSQIASAKPEGTITSLGFFQAAIRRRVPHWNAEVVDYVIGEPTKMGA